MFHSTVHVHPNCIPALTQAVRLKSSVEFLPTTESHMSIWWKIHIILGVCMLVLSVLELSHCGTGWYSLLAQSHTPCYCWWVLTMKLQVPSLLCFLTRVFTTIVCNVMNSSNIGLLQTSRSHWLLCLSMQWPGPMVSRWTGGGGIMAGCGSQLKLWLWHEPCFHSTITFHTCIWLGAVLTAELWRKVHLHTSMEELLVFLH